MTRKFIALAAIGVCAALTACSTHRTESEYLARGTTFMKRKDFSRAALEFRNAVRLQPKDSEAEYQLASVYLAAGKLSDALPALVKATQLNPKDARAQVKLAELMIRSGDVNVIRRGQKRAEEALAAAPENLDALNALALSELELGKPENAKRHLEEALRKFPNNLHSSVEMATLYLTQREFPQAEHVLKAAASAAPHAVEPALALGELYLLLGRWNDAEAQFRRALAIQPKEPRALLGLAAAQLRLGQRDAAENTFRIVSALPEHQYRSLHAVYLFANGHHEAAIKELESLVKSDPKDRETRTRLVTAYLLTGRVSDAERVLNTALKRNGRDTDALLQLSGILLRSGHPRRAEADLNDVLHYRPDSAEAHYLLSRVYAGRGDTVREQSELIRTVHENPALLPARAELAQLYTLSHSPRAALDLLDAAPAFQKQSVLLVVQRNLALLASGDKDGFRKGVAAGLRIARTPDLLLQDAVLKLMDRDGSGARRSFEEVLSQNPGDLRAARGMLLSYAAEKQPVEAKRFLEQYAAAHPKSAAIQQFAGAWLWAHGEQRQARAAFNEAKTADPHYVPAELDLARADIAGGHAAEAESTLTKLIAAHPEFTSAHLLLAIADTKSGKYPVAMQQYREVLNIDPHNRVALNNLAYLLADVAKKPDEALAYAQQAVEAAPDSPDTEGTLGWVFYRKGLYSMAEQYLEEAVSKDGANSGRNAAIRKYHLAMTYLQLGARARGTEMLAEARREYPTLPEAQTAEALLLKTE